MIIKSTQFQCDICKQEIANEDLAMNDNYICISIDPPKPLMVLREMHKGCALDTMAAINRLITSKRVNP